MKNYHTHTSRCHHASGNVLDYTIAAIEKGFTELGFSDHCPNPDNRWLEVRMHMNELSEYVDEIDRAAEKYKQIRILKGAECEYVKEYLNFYRDELLGRYNFDYLIGGAHYFPISGEWISCHHADHSKKNLIAYTDYIISSINSKIFKFIAHPDLFANFYHKWDIEAISCSKAILEAAVDANAILEINGLGYRKPKIETPGGFRKPYPIEEFWELASNYIKSIVINSDAHRPEDLDHFGQAYELAEANSLKIAELDF